MRIRINLMLTFFILTNGSLNAAGTGDLAESSLIDREQQQLQWCFMYSNLLGYNITYINNPRLYQRVSEWIGVPYRYGGDTKKGVDCSGFVCNLFHDCYSKALLGSARDLYKQVEQVRRRDLREGDLVFFKIRAGRISHVGIYLGQNKFVHSSSQRGVVVSDLDDPYFSKYYYNGGRIKL